ncbi:MAG: tRNA (adenosine(37)-N6)-threonylcarbamoyltransferase complex dimerization subunit type 1 TsaB [Defluviitaleaceae bacterium]|nr:tRNA (adenosine(37)-N6)-threonylcarbamoyltransferase complex dimerization subunit type 1 TsaB [Defluviitaleaceae bacterium]
MNILAIEASNNICSVGILQNCNLIAEYTLNNGLSNSQNLMKMIDIILNNTNIKPEKIAVSTGPGSFTGIRIALSTACALSYGWGIPIVQVPTLSVVAYNVLDKKSIIVPIINARRNLVYTSYFTRNEEIAVNFYKKEKNYLDFYRISEYLVTDIEKCVSNIKEIMEKYNFENAIFVGDGVLVYKKYLQDFDTILSKMVFQSAFSLGIVSTLYKDKNYDDIEPMYIRKPQAVREISKVKICEFEDKYFEDVFNILNTCIDDSFSRENLIKDIKSNFTIYLIAKKDKKVIGVCGMWQMTDSCDIVNLAVLPEHRGEGTALKLILEIQKIAISKNISSVFLEVRLSNIVARNLYEKLDFTKSRIRENYYKNPTEDAIVMMKKLK